MISPPINVLDLPVEERALLAMQAAMERIIAEHAREGLPLYIWRDGQVVAVSPEELRSLHKPKP
jgi:hypothetical protein